MNKEEIREYIIAKRTPISHCADLTKYFIGRHKTSPIFLTPTFEMEFNRSMQELEILREQIKKYKEVIDKAINNSQYWIDYYTKLNSDERIALRLQENIDILKEVE